MSWRNLAERFVNRVMRRPADRVIGVAYMERWYVWPRNPVCNLYVHRYSGSDDDRAEHDHPWWSLSYLVRGRLIEFSHHRATPVLAGAWRLRSARMRHRLEVVNGPRPVTLFLTGPRIRQWGFWCPNGWRPWREFTDPADGGQIGRGCD